MKTDKIHIYLLTGFSALAIVFGLYLMLYSEALLMLEYKLFLLFVMASAVGVLWLIYATGRAIGSSLKKTENIEKILLDIRDGSKSFYVERRKSPRLTLKDHFSAKIITKDVSGLFVKVMDISKEGARLKVIKQLKPGEIIDVDMYLPIFPDPVYVKAKIVRANKAGASFNHERNLSDPNPGFDVGVEYMGIAKRDIEKISETIGLLNNGAAKLPSQNLN